ncbi:MAG: succinylglutamate desuccinylase/aspartoacylase family protein [Candidatus Berkiella sp.]
MKNTPLSICKELIQPGEKANLALQMPDFYSCAPLYMPIKIIHSKKAGPCLLVFATIHGYEMNGLEIVNRLINSLEPDQIHGTVIAVPVLNVFGLTHYPKTIPSGQNIAECFPGKIDGKYGERIACIFTQELIKKADYCIELDTGSLNHAILPQVYCNFENQRTKQLAKSFQVPVITNVSLKRNQLRQTTENLDIPLIVYQAGEAMRFDENAINIGVEGVRNFMRCISMIPEKMIDDIKPVFSQDEEWIVANKGGVLHVNVVLGQTIRKGDKIASISDPFSADVEEYVTATQDGVIVGINTTPLIHEGLSIFKVASFIDNHRAESAIESWEVQQQEAQ